MAKQELKHTYRHFADLQLSAQDFYASLEALITSYEYPKVEVSRKYIDGVTFDLYTGAREYLCIRYHNYRYYVCAAPFGRSFFISWWFLYKRSWVMDVLFSSRILSYLFEDKKQTMYRRDTLLMFENSINSIITEFSGTVQPEHGKRRTAPLAIQQMQ